jgi:hypothetical protein
MPRRKPVAPWYEAPVRFPAIYAEYICPCCRETRTSAKYGGWEGSGVPFTCAECNHDMLGFGTRQHPTDRACKYVNE